MSKGVKKVTKAVEDVAKGVGQTISSGAEAIWHTGEAGINLLQGDISGAGKSISKAAGDVARVGVGITPIGIIAPKAAEAAENLTRGVAHYATLNFNQGSQQIENLTGFDLDNSNAEAAERAAQAEYDRQAKEAADAAARNRRANLLATRKSLTPSLSRASQGGGSSSTQINAGSGGIILG